MSDRPWLDGAFAEPITELKEVLVALLADLDAADVESDTRRQLADVTDHLEELFLLVVVGEVKSGKSSFINALFGAKICPEGVTPTTDRINVLKFGDEGVEKHLGEFLVERYLPFDRLKNLHIVDTPGTNSIVREHTEISEEFIPRANLILFVTSIDRPYSESERQYLKLIAERWRKKVLFVLTKIDIKDTEAEVEEVVHYVKLNVDKDFGFDPLVYPCSPKLAYRGRTENDADAWELGRLAPIESYVFETLSDRDKLELKLLSPINVALRLIDDVLEEFEVRLEIIADHARTLASVQKLVLDRSEELRQGYARHILDITNLLGAVRNRGMNFLEDQIQLRNWSKLRQREPFKQEFERQVVQEFERELRETLSRATDEVVRKEMAIWSDTFNLYNEWVALEKYKHRAIGRVSADFEYNRDTIIETVQQSWQANLNAFNYQEQCNRFLDEANDGLWKTMGSFALAGGVATVGALAATGAAATLGLIIAPLFLASFSLLILPGRRRKAVRIFRDRFEELREKLITALDSNIDAEVARLREAISGELTPAQKHFAALEKTTRALRESLTARRGELTEFAGRFEALLEEHFGPREEEGEIAASGDAADADDDLPEADDAEADDGEAAGDVESDNAEDDSATSPASVERADEAAG